MPWTQKREWQRLRPDIHDALRRRRPFKCCTLRITRLSLDARWRRLRETVALLENLATYCKFLRQVASDRRPPLPLPLHGVVRYLLVYLAPSIRTFAQRHKGFRPSCGRGHHAAAELTHKPLIASFACLRMEWRGRSLTGREEGRRNIEQHIEAAAAGTYLGSSEWK